MQNEYITNAKASNAIDEEQVVQNVNEKSSLIQMSWMCIKKQIHGRQQPQFFNQIVLMIVSIPGEE